MKNHDPKKYNDISQRFDQQAAPQNEEEAQVFNAYRWIQKNLREYEVPEVSYKQLADRLRRETLSLSEHESSFYLKRWFWQPAAVVCALLLFIYFAWFHYSPVQKIEYKPLAEHSLDEASFLNSFLIKNRYFFTTPRDQKTIIELNENSRIECEPGTRISIQFDRHRNIFLNKGEILVHAESIPDSTMAVITPLLRTEVVGTVFRVKVIP